MRHRMTPRETSNRKHPGRGPLVLVLIQSFPGVEKGLQPFEGDILPAGDEFGLELVLAGDLGLPLQAGDDFEDDLRLEPRRAGSATALRHRSTLPGWPVLARVLVQSRGRTSAEALH